MLAQVSKQGALVIGLWLGAWAFTIKILLRTNTPRERKTWEAYAHGGRPWVSADPALARWDIPLAR